MSKRTNKPQSLSQTLAETSNLQALQHKVTLINQLNARLSHLLGDTIAKNCRVGNIDTQHLYIECANSNVSMRVQYQKMVILSDFQQHFLPQLSAIDIRINPALNKVEKQLKVESKPMPKIAAKYLTDVAEHAPDGLKQKLQKLAALVVTRNDQDKNN